MEGELRGGIGDWKSNAPGAAIQVIIAAIMRSRGHSRYRESMDMIKHEQVYERDDDDVHDVYGVRTGVRVTN